MMQKSFMNIILELFKENLLATLNMTKQQVTIRQKQAQIRLHESKELLYQIHIYKILSSLQLHQILKPQQEQQLQW
jgi:hypothetical protein